LDSPLQDRIAHLVARVIAENTGHTLALGPDDKLISSGYLDSMSMVNLVIALQSELGVDLDITDMSVDNFESIRAMTALIQSRQ
jgi:acyl carrier protein